MIVHRTMLLLFFASTVAALDRVCETDVDIDCSNQKVETRWRYLDGDCEPFDSCEPFFIFADLGTGNNFKTFDECISTCSPEPEQTDICAHPRTYKGLLCFLPVSYWQFNLDTKKCEQKYGCAFKPFFTSEADCVEECAPVGLCKPAPLHANRVANSVCVGKSVKFWRFENGHCVRHTGCPDDYSMPSEFACQLRCGQTEKSCTRACTELYCPYDSCGHLPNGGCGCINPCDQNACAYCERCIPLNEPSPCLNPPCPQYECLALDDCWVK